MHNELYWKFKIFMTFTPSHYLFTNAEDVYARVLRAVGGRCLEMLLNNSFVKEQKNAGSGRRTGTPIIKYGLCWGHNVFSNESAISGDPSNNRIGPSSFRDILTSIVDTGATRPK